MHREIDDAFVAPGNPVAQRLTKGFAAGDPLRRQTNPRLCLLGSAPPRCGPERPTEDFIPRVAALVDGQIVDLAKVSFKVHDPCEDSRLIEDRLELRGCRPQLFFRLLARRYVASDLRRTDDLARPVLDRRDR